MQLHQILRLIDKNIPIMLFDLEQKMLEEADNKDNLSLKYYESIVFKITVPLFKEGNKNSLYIILME